MLRGRQSPLGSSRKNHPNEENNTFHVLPYKSHAIPSHGMGSTCRLIFIPWTPRSVCHKRYKACQHSFRKEFSCFCFSGWNNQSLRILTKGRHWKSGFRQTNYRRKSTESYGDFASLKKWTIWLRNELQGNGDTIDAVSSRFSSFSSKAIIIFSINVPSAGDF